MEGNTQARALKSTGKVQTHQLFVLLFSNKNRIFECFIVANGNSPSTMYVATRLLLSGHWRTEMSTYSVSK